MQTIWYKLTDQQGYTRKGLTGETFWGEGIQHSATGRGNELCTADLIHVYRDPLLAAFLNPIHAEIKNPVLWVCEAEGDNKHDGQLKSGFKTVTTIQKIDLPEITTNQRVRIAIYCALKVYSEPEFVGWANAWLNGFNRSAAAAKAATRAAWATRAAEAAWATRAAAEVKEFDILSIIKKVIEEGK